ncbi:AMP-binding protein [Chryseobacterium sp. W4I1]|uniref:AMP-binding protein n=1 Tax=Chryseobacterium sp. W4I1 TaxID=3042293 RepID=UPI00277EF016|nr:AMP-binding protein [Chryseobacterium sp. W4I1]MDQ0783956.1 non-ribosomal peptide synthetase component F [Chryseobacterium sp. W4I1]
MPNTISTPSGQPAGVPVFLSPEDRERLLNDFNKTNWDYHKEETLVSLFKKQALLHPKNFAAVYQENRMNYIELDQKSNQLANVLLEKGVKEGMFVPVWLDRSLEWLVVILGILKTGAAYVPIDPGYPVKRVEYILADTSAEILITDTQRGNLLREGINAEIFHLDNTESLSHLSAELPDITINQDALAYTIYTSGSTGNPKGVMISHHSIQHLVTWHNQYFHVDDTSHLTLVAGLAFDISVWEIWSALIAGAILYIADNEDRVGPSELVNFYRRNQITHGFVPSVLAPSVVEETRKYNDLKLKYLFTAGGKT